MSLRLLTACFFCLCLQAATLAQRPKKISPDLFGIFFEDISYAADGGLYAEMVQNRSFEYSPTDRKGWNALTSWDYLTDGFGYGNISVESSSPLHPNNKHYVLLTIEEPGQKGIGIRNNGFDGMVIRKGAQYHFSLFAKQESPGAGVATEVSLQNNKGEILAASKSSINNKEWKKYELTLTADGSTDSAQLVIRFTSKGSVALDMVSLFPEKTFQNRDNGLRADLAQTIADLHPKFMRFPGGCLVHGDGLGNMYRWKNTIGPVEQRIEQKNSWNYHQSAGLGYFEYFQFCEDIGAKPLPVVPAAVSCQNSGGTWRIGGTGQRGLEPDELKTYIQDVLDLIEYANGSKDSYWGAKRAAAGHPEPFHLEYIGIGNEDKITPVFKERFQKIYAAVKEKYPAVTVIGTVGPAPAGEDFELGWQFANEQKVPIVDEHYYEAPAWFLSNQHRYDHYNRNLSGVYIGEYASRGNTLGNALAEAVYMTSLERNADVVRMASYAPLLANQQHTSWNPNLIYFTNTRILPTVNYYVQQLFSRNQGDLYYDGLVSFAQKDSVLAASCVKDTRTGDLIIKIVNAGPAQTVADIQLGSLLAKNASAEVQVLSGEPGMKNTWEHPETIVPKMAAIQPGRKMQYDVIPYSLTVIRVKK